MPENFEKYLSTCLYNAYRDARKGKRTTIDEHRFEVNEFENLARLARSIINRTYSPSGGTRHIIEDPVRREIIAAPFPDRIVHHFICDHIVPWWENRYIYSSYSCRKGKGTDFGIYDLQRHMRRVSRNGAIETYIIKLDIEGYFMHISHKILYRLLAEGLDKQYPSGGELYRTLKFLIKQTVFDNPQEKLIDKCSPGDIAKLVPEKCLGMQPKGQGLVIGNYTSQVFSNVYLNQLDRFVTETLGYKHYGRYVDDFFYIVPKTELHTAVKAIDEIADYLKTINLTLHPRKRYIQNIRRGVPFLGAIIYLDHVVAGERSRKNLARTAYWLSTGSKDVSIESLQSHLGHLVHKDAKRFEKHIFDEFGWRYPF